LTRENRGLRIEPTREGKTSTGFYPFIFYRGENTIKRSVKLGNLFKGISKGGILSYHNKIKLSSSLRPHQRKELSFGANPQKKKRKKEIPRITLRERQLFGRALGLPKKKIFRLRSAQRTEGRKRG